MNKRKHTSDGEFAREVFWSAVMTAVGVTIIIYVSSLGN
jgi:hypothetical protein